jgi:hypothetical protein
MKPCIACHIQKPIECFYKHKAMKDGHLNKCIECCKKHEHLRRVSKIEEIRAYDRMRGSLPHRLEANRLRQKTEQGKLIHLQANERYKEKYKNRHAARHIVGNALRDGKIFKQPCFVCGDPKTEGHHPDYDRPLEVVWLCMKHHKEAHKMTNELLRNQG